MPKAKDAGKKGGSKAKPGDKAPKANPDTKFAPSARSFGIGGDIIPKGDLGRFVKWPKYVRLQRQNRVLYKRLKVPPAINQFTLTADKGTATEIFKLLHKYRPESKKDKAARLKQEAEAKPESPKPVTIKYGLNHVVSL